MPSTPLTPEAPPTRNKARICPQSAFVLAAGLGKRMRPLTDTRPKPLIQVNGKALIDYAFERLEEAGVRKVMVNVHYLASQIEAHCQKVTGLDISICDERGALLDTGGGLKKALPLLGKGSFFLLNADSFWIEEETSNLLGLCQAWDGAHMDMLLLLAPRLKAIGYDGPGDFFRTRDGRLQRRNKEGLAPYVYAGAAIIHPRAFKGAPEGPFPLSRLFEAASQQGRLSGVELHGVWLHVGTPQAVKAAEEATGGRTG